MSRFLRGAYLFSIVLGTSACLHHSAQPDRPCFTTGHEKYLVTVDGVRMAVFEDYSYANGVATFRRGISPPNSMILDWRDFTITHPLALEKHDLLVYKVSENRDDFMPLVELQGTSMVEATADPAADQPACLVIDELQVRVGRAGQQRAEQTGERPVVLKRPRN